VARGFGQVTHGAALADQAGLSGTELGIGLAIMRLASLGGLPVTALADRFGRRMMLLVTVGAGLAITVAAAASPGSRNPTGSPWPQPDPSIRSPCSAPSPGRSGAAWR